MVRQLITRTNDSRSFRYEIWAGIWRSPDESKIISAYENKYRRLIATYAEPNYHKVGDTPETIDIEHLTRIVKTTLAAMAILDSS